MIFPKIWNKKLKKKDKNKNTQKSQKFNIEAYEPLNNENKDELFSIKK